MAGRPRRSTVDYFPHYVNHSRTMEIIEARYGNDGYAGWFKLLELLGKSEGHFYDASSQINFEFLGTKIKVCSHFRAGNTPEIQIADFLNLLAALEAIDSDLWTKNRVIWCQHLVENLEDVYRKRKLQLPQKPNIRAGNLISAPEIQISASENTQRRGEESIVNTPTPTPSPISNESSAIENSTNPSPLKGMNGKRTFLEYVKITEEEHARLLKDFGDTQANWMIAELDRYIGAMPKKRNKYTDHNRVLRGWVLERYQEKHPGCAKVDVGRKANQKAMKELEEIEKLEAKYAVRPQ